MLTVPPFVTITPMGDGDAFTIGNEATGRYFTANQQSVAFLKAIRRGATAERAAALAGVPGPALSALMQQMVRHGVLVELGMTQIAPPPAPPLESRAMSMRFDLIDAGPLTRRLAWLGQLAYSWGGLVVWLVLALAALVAVLGAPDKLRFAMQQIPDTTLGAALLFAAVLALTKVVHEMGHALAYQAMCAAEGIRTGPIRMGMAVFAMTPFPFTDVTGAWRLRSRWRRAVIGAGGLYFELGLIFVLVLIWAGTSPGPLQAVIFQVAMFSLAAGVLLNLNPLVKLDGYYVFTDLLGQANIAGRASVAARRSFARGLGADLPRPDRAMLAYWGLSYAYRWTIFAGVFWLAYQVDPQLAVVVVGIVVLMLVVRPLAASLGFARQQGVRAMNVSVTGVVLGLALLAAFIPFRDRVLLDGQLVRFDTEFVRVQDVAQVGLSASGLPVLKSRVLQDDLIDLTLRGQLLDTARRGLDRSALEAARLEADIAQIAGMKTELTDRIAGLQITQAENAVWTPLAAPDLMQAWVRPDQGHVLGGLSAPITPELRLWLDQSLFEDDLLSDPDPLQMRLTHDPTCAFPARLIRSADATIFENNALRLVARPDQGLPACAKQVHSGAGVVARLTARRKSVAERLWRFATRSLQNRLPIDRLSAQKDGPA